MNFFSEQEKWWKQSSVYWIKPVLTAKKLHVLMDLSVIINMLALKCLTLFAKVAKTRWLEFRKILWCLFTILLGPKIQIGIVVITIRTSWKGVLSRYVLMYLLIFIALYDKIICQKNWKSENDKFEFLWKTGHLKQKFPLLLQLFWHL